MTSLPYVKIIIIIIIIIIITIIIISSVNSAFQGKIHRDTLFFFIRNSIKKKNSVCLSVLKSKIKEWDSDNSKCRLCMKYLGVAFF